MKTIYAVWHQAEGVVTTHLFERVPTDAQMQALRTELERRHNRPGMEMRVRTVALLGRDELPEYEERGAWPGETGASAEVAMFTVSGKGEVR